EFSVEDLVGLPKYNIYLKLMVDGIASKPFSAATLSPFQLPEVTNRDKIIKSSQERYGTRRTKIEGKIVRWSRVRNTEG
ncbi:MAG: hypothetical protein V3S39_06795, partial [Thermodesulfobacteriota bacterium]